MGSKRRKYSRELKVELVERVLAGRSALEVARDGEISPSLIKSGKKNIWMESFTVHRQATQS